MTQSSHELRERIFEETDAITLNVIPERPTAELPTNNEAAYQTGYEDALIDAKIYFRMAIMRILGEKP